MSISLLDDEAYCCETQSFIRYWSTRKTSFEDLRQWWDTGKEKIKDIAIKYSIRRSRERRNKELNLIQKLTLAKNENIVDLQEIQSIEYELTVISDVEARGASIRSRASWLEQGERPTSFFFNLEKRKQVKSCITHLKTDASPVTAKF